MKKKIFKVPRSIGECADKLFNLRNQRLEAQHEIDDLKAEETALANYIINTLPKSQASGVAGKVARVTVVTKEIPQVKDWQAFYKHVKKTGEFELLGRRLSTEAVKERWEKGKKVPGVVAFPAVTVSLNKL